MGGLGNRCRWWCRAAMENFVNRWKESCAGTRVLWGSVGIRGTEGDVELTTLLNCDWKLMDILMEFKVVHVKLKGQCSVCGKGFLFKAHTTINEGHV